MKCRTPAFHAVWTLVLPCLFSVSLPGQGSAQTQCDRSPILVRHTSVWSPVGATQDRDVLFENDSIASIRPGGTMTPSPETRILDGRGQTLLPGLIDLHLHFGVPGGLPEFDPPLPSTHWGITGRQLLRSGVTSGRIHFTSLAAGESIKKEAANPCSALPRLQVGGPGMAGGIPDTERPNYVGVKSADDAVAKVRQVAEAGLEWIAVDDADKFLPGELQALTTAARNSGIRLMGAANRAEELEALLVTGVDTIDYIDTSVATRYPDRLLRRLQDSPQVTLVPTIGYHYRIHAFEGNGHLLESRSNYEFLTPAERAFVWSNARVALKKDPYIVNSRRVYPALRTKFQQLLATGTSIATGTDVGSACHFQSGGIWWELEAWRAFGAGSRQALTAATAAGARVLRDERAGALREGGYADFVLYSGDAEKGAFDLGRVRAVAKAGVLFLKDGEWVGPREDGKYVAGRRWRASML